jgi:hypothetical protein
MMAGINQLVDTYKGNPQPLNAKVQQAQQKQPPGSIPPDLEEAIALQKIAELRNGAQNQQAMQAGGAQPSVMEKLRQLLGIQQQQMAQANQMPQQMVQRPVMAARGGSIDQLMSNLGRNYSTGGIIAFAEPTEENNRSLVEDPNGEPLDPKVARELVRRLEERTSERRPAKDEGMDKETLEKTAAGLTAASALSLPYGMSSAMAVDMLRRGFTKPIWRPGTSASSAIGQTVSGAAVPLATVTGGSIASMKAMQDLQAMSPEQRRALAANPMLSAMSDNAGLAAAIQEAGNDEPRKNKSSYFEQVGNALASIPKMAGSAGLEALKHIVSAPGYGLQSDFSSKPTPRQPINTTPTAEALAQGVAPMPGPDRAGSRRSMDEIIAEQIAAAQAGKKPSGGAGVGGGGGTTQKVDPNSLDAITRAYLKGEFAVNPETEREKAVDWTKKTLGLDALLAEKQGRIDAREKAIAAAQAARTPEWVKGLQAVGGAPIRGGAGMVLAQAGAGATKAREAYAAQDLDYLQELDRLRDVITDAKISGNKELVKEGMAAYKEVDARRRAAAQSAASMLNVDATNAARLQQANLSAQARRDAQQQQANYQLEKLKQGERAQQIRIAQAGITAQRPAIDAAAKEAKMHRMVYEALKDRDPDKAAAALDRAEEAQHRIDMILAPLSGIAGSSAAAAPTGAPAPTTGGAKFLGFEPSKKS